MSQPIVGSTISSFYRQKNYEATTVWWP
jgi:hypothetical protein